MHSSRSILFTSLSLLALTVFLAPDAKAIGILVPNQPGLSALKLVHHRVEVEVNERGSKTKVIQEFKNETGRQLEATYLFPLPKNATVDEFALYMNGKREIGKVMERKKARAIYESIVRRAQDPGLIEYVDAQLFQARVFPIPANGTQKVELTYTHLVPYEGGLHRYIYPMKTDQHATRTMNDFTMTVKVKSKLPIKNLYSPTHKVATRRKGTTGIASFEEASFSLSDDFVLMWSVDDKDVGLTLLTHKSGDDAGYFMLLASPKDALRDKEIIGKKVSFVVDTSGSMTGEKMEATRRSLDYCISQLGEDDLFNVITFGGYVEPFSDKMIAASAANKKRARTFVKGIEPLGGTNIDEALEAAMKGVTGSSKVPHMVVFLTDGRPTVGETDVQKILDNAKGHNRSNARIFVFGVGDDVNTTLLDTLAENASGNATYLEGNAALESGLKSFYDKISHPVLSDLKLNIDGVRTFGTHPRRLPDLFKGSQLVVLGRYRKGGKARVTLDGSTRRGKQKYRFVGKFAEQEEGNEFVARLWAQRQVGQLLQEIRLKGETKGLVAEVTQLATAFGIVTPYTSYLVVEPGFNRPQPQPRRRDRPVFGVDGEGSGGGGAPQAAAEEADDGFRIPLGNGFGRGARAKKGDAKRKMKADTGREAVAASKSIGGLRDSKVAGQKARTKTVRTMGRTFTFKEGKYVDDTLKRSDKNVVVEAYSKAYFALLKAHPKLKSAFALGARVKVRLKRGLSVEVAPSGVSAASDKALAPYLR